MPIGAIIGGGLGLLGGMLGADATESAARTSANAQLEAAKIAADAAKFRPYAVTTGFGTSAFDEANQTAGYTLDPRLQAIRDAYYNLGQQALGGVTLDPTAAAQQYYQQQQGLLAPTRAAEDVALRQQQLQRGRIGLGLSGEAVGAGAGTGYVNPEQYQRDLARAQADAQLAASSQAQSQADIDRAIARGQGLLSSGFGVEQLGMTPLTTGAELGGRAASAGSQQANALLQGGMGAAQTNLAAGLGQAQMYQNMFGNLGRQDWSGLFNQAPQIASNYGITQNQLMSGLAGSNSMGPFPR